MEEQRTNIKKITSLLTAASFVATSTAAWGDKYEWIDSFTSITTPNNVKFDFVQAGQPNYSSDGGNSDLDIRFICPDNPSIRGTAEVASKGYFHGYKNPLKTECAASGIDVKFIDAAGKSEDFLVFPINLQGPWLVNLSGNGVWKIDSKQQ